MKAVSVGLCQAKVMGDLMALHYDGASMTHLGAASLSSDDWTEDVRTADIVYVQSSFRKKFAVFAERNSVTPKQVRHTPTIFFNGYHPDFSYFSGLRGPTGKAVSVIASYAFLCGLSEARAVDTFNARTYETLGYFDYFDISKSELFKDCDAADIDVRSQFDAWVKNAPFVYTPNHPSRDVLSDIVLALGELDGVGLRHDRDLAGINDYRGLGSWPLYPEIAAAHGLDGDMLFKRKAMLTSGKLGLEHLDLRAYVELFYEANAGADKNRIMSALNANPVHKRGLEVVGSARNARTHRSRGGSALNPYAGLPSHHFWRKAVAGASVAEFDPVVSARFGVERQTKIATAGSCFAQHVARHLRANAFNYFTVESGSSLPENGDAPEQIEIFSARYGNIYTARQLVQLFDRSEGSFEPVDQVWRKQDRYIDPFRPEIEPEGFATSDDVTDARDNHLRQVRRLWRELDVFVFTLGLTEAWRSKTDGAVFPVAPGVISEQVDPDAYEFCNFTAREVRNDLSRFFGRLKRVNPRARMILTVSPVPLVATYENRHVLVSTTYSKSVLRVAAEEAMSASPDIDYFPSYEIITGAFNRGRYFGEDLRSVTEQGVGHVMRVFLKAFSGRPSTPAVPSAEGAGERKLPPVLTEDWTSSVISGLRDGRTVVCEEELNDVD